MQQELVFSADCAINFDDLGEFKDYSQDIENMLENLKQVQITNRIQLLNEPLLRQILKADPQDTFHTPAFKDLIQIILSLLIHNSKQIKSRQKLYKLIFHNLMEILQQSLVSCQFQQDINPKIFTFLKDQSKRNQLKSFQKMQILMFLTKMSKKLSYIDNYQNLAQLMFYSLNEETILMQKDVTQDWKIMMLNVYAQLVQQIMRNRQLRKIMIQKINDQSMELLEHLFLGYKVYLWQKNEQKIQLFQKRVQSIKDKQLIRLLNERLTPI